LGVGYRKSLVNRLIWWERWVEKLISQMLGGRPRGEKYANIIEEKYEK
jgi:hypothetical protein